MFQFYLSSIKSVTERNGHWLILMFQFYLSSIKSGPDAQLSDLQASFNSTLVQLKVID